MWVAGCRGQCAGAPRSERVELGVPVKVVAPAFMQVVWREGAAILLKHVGRRLNRAVARVHLALPRHQMVKGQLMRRIRLATILAGKTVSEKDVEACKRRMPC